MLSQDISMKRTNNGYRFYDEILWQTMQTGEM